MGADVNIQVSQEVVKPIIEAKIHAAILSEFSKVNEQLIDSLVTKIINTKVDSEGKPNNYSSNIPWLQWSVQDTIMRVAKETMSEIIEQQRPAIKKELTKAIAKQKTTIAENFVGFLIETTKDKWRTNVKIEFQKPHD